MDDNDVEKCYINCFLSEVRLTEDVKTVVFNFNNEISNILNQRLKEKYNNGKQNSIDNLQQEVRNSKSTRSVSRPK
jgi:uncharacterized membrane protein YheB (UPF0754 family)